MKKMAFYRRLEKFGKEEIVNLICVYSSYEKDELLKMQNFELEDLWYELEMDECLYNDTL